LNKLNATKMQTIKGCVILCSTKSLVDKGGFMKKIISMILALFLFAGGINVSAVEQDIVDIAAGDPQFSILVEALTEAGLVEALQGPGPFTVFAPTDTAFAALLVELGVSKEYLLNHPQLSEILLYHVVAGTVLSTDLVDGSTPATLNGETITVDLDGGVFINDAEVTTADILATNGVIHVIDKVLIPSDFVLYPTVVDIAVNNDGFSVLVAALQEAELVEALQGPGPFTVFAPTDAAFTALLADLGVSAEYLLGHPQLSEILLYHVVAGKVMSTDLVDGSTPATLNGETITVDLDGGVFINDASVVLADLEAGNGVVHVIDKVLIPSDFVLYPTVVDVALSNPDFSILVAALQKADLVDALLAEGPFTVFAPTNAAFADLLDALDLTAEELLAQPDLAKVLLFHVISGEIFSTTLLDEMTVMTLNGESVTFTEGSWFVEDAQIIAADIEAGNGIVHVIDKVIIPSNFELVLPTVVDIALSNPDFSILVAALQKAGLVEALQGEGPFTVFAPTNAAFAALLAAIDLTAEELLAQPDLAKVLLFHVISGKVMSTALVDDMTATTLNGESVTFTEGSWFVEDAEIIAVDIEALNGVVHVIDKVLIPANFELVPPTVVDIALGNPDFSILVAALQKAGLVEALQGEGPFTVFAPTNAAFEALLAAIDLTAEELLAQPDLAKVLLFHVISGKVMSTDLVADMTATTLNGESVTFTEGSWFVEDAEIIAVDIVALNGVVHVIDKVIIPTNFELVPPTVVDIALGNPDFSILVAALQKAGLVEALQGEGPFTVFAPTNAAFADLLAALDITAEELLAQPDLAKVLLFHVISGKVMSTDLVADMTATTLNGQSVTFTEGSWFVEDAEIIAVDFVALNGVVHVIDKVIIPTNFTFVPPEELPDTSDNNALGLAYIALMAGFGLLVLSSKKRSSKKS
jgi:transforming growth factor-beta-induced protein